jgi:hypothetical protein
MASVKTTESSLESSARALFFGLLWGAGILFIFGFWMRAKVDAANMTKAYVFWIAGAAALAVAVWQAFTLWGQKTAPAQKDESLRGQRHLIAYLLMAGGLGLIVMSFVLGIDKRPSGNYGFVLDNFGESIGVLFFGAIAMSAGVLMQIAPQETSTTPVQTLASKQPILKLATLILGLAAIGAFGYLAYQTFVKQNELVSLVEITALLFFSILCFACFLWLNTGVLDENEMRMLVLIFGGGAGVILFFLSIGRAYVWREDVYMGGLGAWQGEFGYRFWICAYLMFASLVLMFVSFNLARADIRTNVNLRRLMYGYDAVAQILLLLGILAVLNIVVYAAAPFTYDWTKSRGTYALSPSSQKVIAGLKEETNVVVLLSQNSPVYKDMRIMLDNSQYLNSKLKVTYAAPDTNPMEYIRYVKLFPKIKIDLAEGTASRGVLVVNGPIPQDEKHNTAYAFLPERSLFDFDRGMPGGAGPKLTFKGESELLKEVKFLQSDASKRKIYVLQGNDELSISKQDPTERLDFRQGFGSVGMQMLVDKLKQEKYDITGLTFQKDFGGDKTPNLVYAKESATGKGREVPSDCHTLIIPGSSKMLPSEALDAIGKFAENGGKLMVFMDVIVTPDYAGMKETGLEGLLKRFGVEVKNEFSLRLMNSPRDDPRFLVASTAEKSSHPLTKQFEDDIFLLERSARVITPTSQPGGRYKAETILNLPTPESDFPSVNETNVRVLQEPQKYIVDLLKNRPKLMQVVNRQPVSVAVAVKDTQGDKPSMVVFGDADFISNREIATSKSSRQAYDFIVSTLEWMAEREEIGARPKVNTVFQLKPAVAANAARMEYLPGFVMLLFIIGLGTTVWVVRRR